MVTALLLAACGSHTSRPRAIPDASATDANIGGCFAAGTRIATPRGPTPIELIRVGDWVQGYDFVLGRVEPRRVLATTAHGPKRVGQIEIADGTVLHVTAEHPIYSAAAGAYVPADRLAGGTVLQYAEAWSVAEREATTWSASAAAVPVFDLTVDGTHDYFAEGVLVHNKDRPCEPPDYCGVYDAGWPSACDAGLGYGVAQSCPGGAGFNVCLGDPCTAGADVVSADPASSLRLSFCTPDPSLPLALNFTAIFNAGDGGGPAIVVSTSAPGCASAQELERFELGTSGRTNRCLMIQPVTAETSLLFSVLSGGGVNLTGLRLGTTCSDAADASVDAADAAISDAGNEGG